MILYEFHGSILTKRECNEPPAGIIVTWSKDMINDQGGLFKFIRYMNWVIDREAEGWTWLHKCRMCPQQDIFHVYVVLNGRIRYRFYYGGFEAGGTIIGKADGTQEEVTWSRIILAGPVVKAPGKFFIKGFQGFRYCNEIF